MTTRRTSERGFTLIEIGVVLAVAMMLVGVALPALRNVTGAEARSAVNKLAANIRATRGAAAVSGRTCRLVFDLDAHHYTVECAEGVAQVAQERARNGARDDSRDERMINPRDLARMSEAEQFEYALKHRTQFAPEPTLEPQPLTGGLELLQVWTGHQDKPYDSGIATLYFFPSGLGEPASIQLAAGDAEYTLLVSPLGGRVRLVQGLVDYPQFDSED